MRACMHGCDRMLVTTLKAPACAAYRMTTPVGQAILSCMVWQGAKCFAGHQGAEDLWLVRLTWAAWTIRLEEVPKPNAVYVSRRTSPALPSQA